MNGWTSVSTKLLVIEENLRRAERLKRRTELALGASIGLNIILILELVTR